MDVNKLILCDLISSIDPTFVVSEGQDFFYIHKGKHSNTLDGFGDAVDFLWILDSFIIDIKDSIVTIDGVSNMVEINLAELDSLERLKSAIKLNMIEVDKFYERPSGHN